MAKADFEKYNGGQSEFIHYGEKKFDGFNDVQGGGEHVDPYGNMEKKERDALDMNAGEAFNKKDLSKIDAMGSDYPKKGNYEQKNSNKGEHFSTEEANESINPFGTEAGKSKSFQSRH